MEEQQDVKTTLIKSIFGYLFRTSPFLLFFHSLMFVLWGFTFLFIYDVYSYVQKGNSIIKYFEENLDIGNDHYVQYTILSKKAEDLLEEFRQKLGAKEVSVYLLHNGKASLGGIPFLKVSQFATIKYSQNSIVRILDEPINNFPDLQATLRGEIVYYNLMDLSPGSITRTLYGNNNHEFVRGPLFKTFEGVPHGWITIVFEDGKTLDRELLKEQIDFYTIIFQTMFDLLPRKK